MPSPRSTRCHALDLLERDRGLGDVTVEVHFHHRLCTDRPLQGVGRVADEHLAVVDDREPSAEQVGLFHVVRREQDRRAGPVELADRLPQREAALRVETRGRLVEEQHVGTMGDRPRDLQPLRHAARERVRRRLGAVRELELLEQLVCPDLRRPRAPSEVPAVVDEVLDDGARAVERVELRHHSDAPAHGRRVRDDIDASDAHIVLRSG